MHRTQHTEGQNQPTNDQIIRALKAVLESDKFTAAPQMSAFLRYVVEQAASGNMTRIKAYTVAIDALGKPDSFDPQNDPVVRVLAGRLRAALASYYEANPDLDLRITMRPGSYVPSFVYQSAGESSVGASTATAANQVGLSVDPVAKIKRLGALSLDSTTPTKPLENEGAPEAQVTISSTTATAHVETTPNVVSNNSMDKANRDYASHFRWLFSLPAIGVALAVMGVFVGSQLTQYQAASDPDDSRASALQDRNSFVQPPRKRPRQISLFVSALEQKNSLNDQLNTMLSGVFSESTSLYVYRVFDSNHSTQHWPEDYLVSVDILPLPTETRVSVQLVEAQTGRVSHSQNIALSKDAAQGLSGNELDIITKFARQLIGEKGPLFKDYNTKLASANQ